MYKIKKKLQNLFYSKYESHSQFEEEKNWERGMGTVPLLVCRLFPSLNSFLQYNINILFLKVRWLILLLFKTFKSLSSRQKL